MKRVYISGRIKGLDPVEVERKFNAAEEYLTALGYQAINPYELAKHREGSHWTWGSHIIADLRVLQHCDSIYLLDNWSSSNGANIEWLFARGEGIPEYPLMSKRWKEQD